MSSWGKIDANTSAPKWATTQVNLRPTQANANSLFNNTTANSFAVTLADGSVRQGNTTVGLFLVDTQEEQVAQGTGIKPPHSGWVLRTTGQGGRAGRVTHEVLVCLDTATGDADGQLYPNVAFTLALSGNQTVNSNTSFTNVASFLVTPTVTAGNTNAVFTYNWQYNNASGSYGWANIPANTTNMHFNGATSNTLFAMPGTTANNTNVFRVVVTDAVDGVSVTSGNVSISIPA
jgi:hypothetical protein